MFERLQRSFEMARASWAVLRADKKLALFPTVSAVAVLFVLAGFVGPLVGLHLTGKIDLSLDADGRPPVWVYPVTFAYYFCNYFVIVFCNAALVSCALMRFNGQQPTLGDGFRAAFERLPQIAAWAFVSATVGLILKVVENANEKVGQFVAAILGTAWTVMTFFVVPVLVVEKTGPLDAVARSVSILKKTWGEALAGSVGLGLFKLLLILPGVLLLVAGIALASMVQPAALGLVVVGAAVLYLLGAAAAVAALDTIYLTALYQYAAFDRVPGGFSREAIEGAFYAKK